MHNRLKKLLSLDDLYNFYVEQNKNVNFSSKDENVKIVAHIDEPFNLFYGKEESEDDENLLMSKHYIKFCHTKRNANRSYISKKSMEDAIPTAYNMPILGYIYKNDNGEYVFAGHEFYVDENNETIYEEVPVGVIPESANLKLVYDKEADVDRLEGYGLIWKTYSRASKILEKAKNLSVSIEIEIDELSYSADKKQLNIEKFRFCGVTILQENRYTGEEIKPGMTGSKIGNAEFSDFISESNCVFTKEIINEIKKFNENFECFNKIKQGGKNVMGLFNELLKEYNVSQNDIDFDYENMSEDELKKAFEDKFSKKDPSNENTELGKSDDNSVDNCGTYSLTLPNGNVKNFSLSLSEIQSAIYNLVNDTYSELDNDWYNVDVYEDDKKVVMYSWNGQAYRQNFKRKKDTFSLEGERVPVKRQWISEDEEKMLNEAKENYSLIQEKLEKYEKEPEKIEIINSEEYRVIRNTKEFEEISKRETYFDMSKEDIIKKLDDIVLSYAKRNSLNFSNEDDAEDKDKTHVIPFATKNKLSNYGSLLNI